MDVSKTHNRWVIPVSFLAGLVLAIFPLPRELFWWRPEFIPLLLIYWLLVFPEQVSIIWVFVIGCLLDILTGTALGQHALSMLVICYVCFLSYQRMRQYSVWQQVIFVFVLVGLHQLVGNWVHSLQGGVAPSLSFLLPALTSALLWPFTWISMERTRIFYRIN